MIRPYVFPPVVLVGPLLKFRRTYRQPCTIVILDQYPKRYWWPLLQLYSTKSLILARRGDAHALLRPTPRGWSPVKYLSADLWGFMIDFS